MPQKDADNGRSNRLTVASVGIRISSYQSSRQVSAFLWSFALFVFFVTWSAVAQHLVDENHPRRDELARICARPFAPDPLHYETQSEYISAREIYYLEASVYVSECVDRWIMETRRRYEEMFMLEAEAYLREREAVMDEMRDAGARDF